MNNLYNVDVEVYILDWSINSKQLLLLNLLDYKDYGISIYSPSMLHDRTKRFNGGVEVKTACDVGGMFCSWDSKQIICTPL
jgi:hypothetical protein